jgi:type VI protein secretion system component VasF
MARDILSDLDRLTDQLSELRHQLVKQASATASDVSTSLAPHARHLARQFRSEGYDLSHAMRRNPSAATGAVIGALALGAVLTLLLSGGKDERR